MRTADRVCQKTSYPQREHAENALHRIWRVSWKHGAGKLPCRVYLCECGSYHLTSKGSW